MNKTVRTLVLVSITLVPTAMHSVECLVSGVRRGIIRIPHLIGGIAAIGGTVAIAQHHVEQRAQLNSTAPQPHAAVRALPHTRQTK